MRLMPRIWPSALRGAAVVASVLAFGLVVRSQAPTAPPPSIVSDVIVVNSRRVSAEEVKLQMKTRVGAEYSPVVLEEDVRTLFNSHKFGNVDARTQEDGPGKVKVLLYISDFTGQIEKVTYLGAKHLKDDELNELTNVRVGGPLNPAINKSACQKIVDRLREMGRPYASCVLLKGAEPGDREVIFQITEGAQVVIRKVRFEGNTFVSGARLATLINTKPEVLHLFGGKFIPAMIDGDVNDLEKYYRNFGYHDVKISRAIEWDPDGRSVVVVFHIHEGLRYKVQDVPQVVGAQVVPSEQLQALSQVKQATYYSQATIDGDVQRIKDWYGYLGRNTKVEAVPVWSRDVPGECQVHYEVEERGPDRVGEIIIIGNDRTRQNVILRQLPLYPGQVLTYPDLRLAERNLARLNIFATSPDGSVHPSVTVADPESDNPYKKILVNVQEDNTGSLIFGVGVNSDAGLTGSIVLNERNFDIFRFPTSFDDFLSGNAFRGAGQEFRIEAVPGTQLQRYTVTFREPFLFDSPYSLLLSGYYYQRIFNEYNEDRVGGRVTFGRRLNQYWQANVGGRIEEVGVHNVSPFAPPDYQNVVGSNFLLAGRAGVTRDSRDSFLRPTSGSLLDVSVEQATGNFNFTLANIDFGKYFTVWQRRDGSGRQVLAFHSQFGWASDNTPVYERFFAGGFRTLRGFAFRGVSPDINGFKVGGDFLFLNSLEYQVPVVAKDSVYLVGFVDSGTVSPRIDQIDNYRVAAGFGVRFVVPMLGPVPIALDFGFPIVKGPADNTQVFNFWMGFSR